jgi:signal transduction histidine kinase
LRNRIEGALSDRQLDEEKARETLSTALEEVDRVLNTFNGILRLSRLGAGSGGALNRLDASALANEMAELFAPVCEEDNIAFDTDIAAGLQVLGDRELLGQALANLLDNAVKYVGQPGRISVRVRRRGSEQVELSVCDNGPGIPAADRKRAVERFVRLESSRSEPGSGLGLALVEAIANHHHGVLELSDAGGPAQAPGLCATLILPRAR